MERLDLRRMHVEIIPALSDNYAYLLLDDSRSKAIAIDPSEGAPVLARMAELNLKLEQIWCTHHHPDHVGGIEELRARAGEVPVYGSAYDKEQKRIPFQTHALAEGDTVMAFGESARVIHVPGHTLGAIAYVLGDSIFTGDTMFLAGCGRVFEGTMPQMQTSLERFTKLNPELLVYPGHEYTEKNLEFAIAVEPESVPLQERQQRMRAQRANGFVSVPATLRDELATNPFLRVREPSVIARAKEWGAASTAPAEIFAALRTAKDTFR